MKKTLKKIMVFVVNLFSLFYLSLFITDYSFLFKSGFSNISGFTALFGFLILVLWLINSKSLSGLYFFRTLQWFKRLKDSTLLFIFFLIITAVISTLGISRHMSLSSMGYDMGIFEQTLWNTLHGDMLFSSIRGNFCLLGDHFQPILLLLVPFYAIKPHVATLVILQSIIIAFSVLPIYLIAREKLASRFLIFAFIISFTLSKGIRGVGLSDFHPESFMIPLSLFAYYFLIKRRNSLFFLSCLLLLFCKESSVLIIAGFGLYAFLALKRKVVGVTLIIAAVLSWIIETKIIIPFFNTYDHSYFYYARMPFGNTYSENIGFVIKHFSSFLSFIFMPGKINYIFRLATPLVFLPFFSPAHYVLIFMPLVTILLASKEHAGYFLTSSHYVGAVLPFVYISGICGAKNTVNFFIRRTKFSEQNIYKFISVSIIVLSLFFYGKTDAYKFNKFLNSIKSSRAHEKLSYLSIIPKDAVVCATTNFVPHLSHRKYVYCLELGEKMCFLCEYLVVDFDFQEGLSKDLKMNSREFLGKAREYGYEIIFSEPSNAFFILRNLKNKKTKIEEPRGSLLM